jgi:pimeloyl-ACP methyl ester carboxylesterase
VRIDLDIRLSFEEYGSKSAFPLILLHGNGGSCSDFRYQIPAYENFFHVFAVDTRGHGRSPRGRAPFTISQFADDLYDFMKLHNIEKADILGFSDGANIALLFSSRHPDMVRKLVSNGANLDPSGLQSYYYKPMTALFRFDSFIAFTMNRHCKSKEMLGLMAWQPDIKKEDLSKITCPVLVIAGTHDLIKKEHTEMIASYLADPKLVFIPGSHFISRTHYKKFNDITLSFLCS